MNLCFSLHNKLTIYLYIQVISDRVVRRLLESATNLQVLCLHYCLGSLTSFSFQTKAPALRVLWLHWVTSWLTNDDLTILTENCNLAELSLSGCKLLDSSKFYFQIQDASPPVIWSFWVFTFSRSTGSQDIISSGWPNLALLHLEVCLTAVLIMTIWVNPIIVPVLNIWFPPSKIKIQGSVANIIIWLNK